MHKINKRFKEDKILVKNNKPSFDNWEELQEDDAFVEEFQKAFNNDAIKQANESFSPELFDQHVHMEVALDHGGNHPQLVKVKKWLKDNTGNPIGESNNNPIIDTRLCEVEFPNGCATVMTANCITENMFAQVDEEGHMPALLNSITDTGTDGTQIVHSEVCI